MQTTRLTRHAGRNRAAEAAVTSSVASPSTSQLRLSGNEQFAIDDLQFAIKTCARTNSSRAHRRGLGLVEVVVSALLVGLVVVASMRTVGSVFQMWQVTADQSDGTTLAQFLMTEALQARYEEPDDTPLFGLEGAEAANLRTGWDDVDDYKVWSASPPQANDGTALVGYAGWTRSVVVQKVDALNPATVLSDADPDSGLRRVTVTVTDPLGKQTILTAYRSTSGAVEEAPLVDTTFVTWVGCELQVGGNAAAPSGTNLVNHAVDQ